MARKLTEADLEAGYAALAAAEAADPNYGDWDEDADLETGDPATEADAQDAGRAVEPGEHLIRDLADRPKHG